MLSLNNLTRINTLVQQIHDIDSVPEMDARKEHFVEAVVDRVIVREGILLFLALLAILIGSGVAVYLSEDLQTRLFGPEGAPWVPTPTPTPTPMTARTRPPVSAPSTKASRPSRITRSAFLPTSTEPISFSF